MFGQGNHSLRRVSIVGDKARRRSPAVSSIPPKNRLLAALSFAIVDCDAAPPRARPELRNRRRSCSRNSRNSSRRGT
jgi:hypothetical protein